MEKKGPWNSAKLEECSLLNSLLSIQQKLGPSTSLFPTALLTDVLSDSGGGTGSPTSSTSNGIGATENSGSDNNAAATVPSGYDMGNVFRSWYMSIPLSTEHMCFCLFVTNRLSLNKKRK